MSASLVGSEMCIRDRSGRKPVASSSRNYFARRVRRSQAPVATPVASVLPCLLYTSDAADDM
eukprot:11779066-Alexandrium_andersonii.AAC.1